MEFINVLTRDEMKNIMGGSPCPAADGCNLSKCQGSSAVFNCWEAACGACYAGTGSYYQCKNQVDQAFDQWVHHCKGMVS